MKLKNRTSVKNSNVAIMISYSFLGSLLLSIIALIYFNLRSTSSSASNITPKENTVKRSGNDFRILQNGKPIDPIMGIGVNAEGIFEIQIRPGVELRKIKTKPIAAEISILRGQEKVSTIKFNDIIEVKAKNLSEWMNNNYVPRDKMAIELFNTILEPTESVKVYSLAAVY
jgi:hypothetical protein